MGQAKQLWMEMEECEWEYIETEFICPECNEHTFAGLDLPIVYENGEEHEFPISVRCMHCGKDFQATLTTDWDYCEVTFDDYPKTEFSCEPMRGIISEPDYDYDYLQHETADVLRTNSEINFQATLSGLRQIAHTLAVMPHRDIVARMMFVQAITALEAYLSDILISEVSTRTDAQERILQSKELGIGQQTFTLKEAQGVKNFSQDRLLHFLKETTFHNLKKAQKLFQVGLQINIVPDDTELSVINKSILIRHDCVHRNGRAKDSDSYHVISKDQLTELIDAVDAVAKRIADALWPF